MSVSTAAGGGCALYSQALGDCNAVKDEGHVVHLYIRGTAPPLPAMPPMEAHMPLLGQPYLKGCPVSQACHPRQVDASARLRPQPASHDTLDTG